MRLMLTVIFFLVILFLTTLLVAAYVIAPIVSWLAANPLGGVALLVIIIVLVGILAREEMKEM